MFRGGISRLTMPGVALDHLVGGLEAGVRHLGHGQLLVVGLQPRAPIISKVLENATGTVSI